MGRVVIGAGFLYLAVGIASLVIATQNPTPNCGLRGSPPLRDWIFGTGIAYTIIGACCSIFGLLLVCTIVGFIPFVIIMMCSGAFTFAWMIVGAVSLWRDGGDCASLNYPVWAMGMAGVIISIVMVAGVTCGSASASRDQ